MNTTPKIIAFGYNKSAGKSTAGKFLNDILKRENSRIIKQVSFAAKLKDISHQLYAWAGLQPGIYYETHYREKEIVLPQLNLSPREIWIQVGNKLREVYQNTWLSYVFNGIEADIIIITDLRFQNEANAVKKAGGILVKINRPNMPQGTDPAEVDLDHYSDWDFEINNDGTLQDFYKQIEVLSHDIFSTK